LSKKSPQNTVDLVYGAIKKSACVVASIFNQNTLQWRRDLKSYYKESKSLGIGEERHRLSKL